MRDRQDSQDAKREPDEQVDALARTAIDAAIELVRRVVLSPEV